MSLQFIIGRAGSGKTTYCLDAIRQKLIENPEGSPLILLVPEQATFQAEKALVTSPGVSGMIRAQVLSFRRLAYRVLQETGGIVQQPIDETGKMLLLYKVFRKCEEELQQLRGTLGEIGFIDELRSFFDELARYRVSPEELQQLLKTYESVWKQSSPSFAAKMHDMMLLFRTYEQALSKGYNDGEAMLERFSQQAEQSSYLSSAQIWIDGFNGFTPSERAALAALMKTAQSVHMTMTLDKPVEAGETPEELDLFFPTGKTMGEIRQAAREAGVDEKPPIILRSPDEVRFKHNPVLAHLEAHFADRKTFENKQIIPPVDSRLMIRSAANLRAEVSGMAREMIRLVKQHGYRWRDFAVILRNPQSYQDLLRTTLDDFGIPYFFDQKRQVLDHPLIELIRSALEVVKNNWRYDDVFRCVKTDFFLPLASDHADAEEAEPHQRRWKRRMDQLENYVLAYGVYGSRWKDEHTWKLRGRVSLEDDPEQEERVNKSQEIEHQRLLEARDQVMRPLQSFESRAKKASDVREWITALFQLLEDVQARQRLEAWSEHYLAIGEPEKSKEHVQIWERVMDMFDQMVEICGDERINIELFSGLIETGLSGIRMALVPPALDQVLIGSMDRTRSGNIRCCFVLGANDGLLPQPVAENGILTELEREKLSDHGLELAPGSQRKLLDEQFLIYMALTTADERLWISYPIADEEGKTLLPSEIVRRLQRMFPDSHEQFLTDEPPLMQPSEEQLEWIVRPSQAMADLVHQIRLWKEGKSIDPIWWDVYHTFLSDEKWRDQLEQMLYGLFFTNKEADLTKETTQELYGDVLQASVSRMEMFVSCPFAQFASYGLKLQDRLVYRLEAPDIGQLFHAALKMIAVDLQQNRLSWADLTAEQCMQKADQVVDQLSPKLQHEILLSTKRYRYIARKLKQIVGRASIVLGEHARRGAFVPVGLEIEFGRNAAVPPLTFQLKNGRKMEIRGRIDRIDQAKGENGTYLRIIDYKSSETSLQLAEVFYGLSLQMLTYLDVVITHSKKWLGEEAIPAGVLYFHVHNPMLNTSNRISREKAEKELFKKFKMKGWLLAETEAVRLMDTTLDRGHSEIVPVGLKAGGGFYKNSSVLSESGWDNVRKFTRKKIRQIGTEMTDGKVDVAPYRLGKKTPCQFCSFRPVCQFDTSFEGNDYRSFDAKSQDELWEQMELTLEEGEEKQ